MKRQLGKLLFVFLTVATSNLFAEELFLPQLEAKIITNICQVTSPAMSFEKAGEAYFSPDGQTIIFQAVPKGEEQYQIYTLNLKKAVPKRVSTGKGSCTCAYFRPDGKKIIFASSHEDPKLKNENFEPSSPGYKREGGDYEWDFTPYMNIYEANPNGTQLTALTSGPAYHAECAYSPDGSHIVFASNLDGSMNLYTMRSNGTDIRQITHTVDRYNGGPFFSPDGSKIIFRADYEKPHYLQIYMINADGTGLKQLTTNGAVNWAPFWHPNGKIIAFTTSLHGHAHYEVYLLNVLTGVSCRLTHNSSFDGLPVFSPDGKKILWTSKRGPDKTCQLFIADFKIPSELE